MASLLNAFSKINKLYGLELNFFLCQEYEVSFSMSFPLYSDY